MSEKQSPSATASQNSADLATVVEVLPPGPNTISTAESLLAQSGGDVSAALDKYFSSGDVVPVPSVVAAQSAPLLASRSSTLPSHPKVDTTKSRPAPVGALPLSAALSGRKRPRPTAPSAPCPSSAATPAQAPTGHVVRKQARRAGTMTPLAERVRPSQISDVVGQEAFAPESPLGRLLLEDRFPSSVLWGPPGSGKTSIALIVSRTTKRRFIKLSATEAGVKEVRAIVDEATKRRNLTSQGTVLFLDEIHRWNKTQQDVLLPHVESGLIALIGATTENPSFSLNKALLSRCRVVVLAKLQVDGVVSILRGALSNSSSGLPRNVEVSNEVLTGLAQMADGDARAALNALELAIDMSTPPGLSGSTLDHNRAPVVVSAEATKKGLQRTHLLYDRAGEEHYNIISALHKSLRASDVDASLYWLARMLESGEDARYVTRRLVRFASEDIGLADPGALLQATAAHTAAEKLGMPECDVVVAHATAYLARAPKSVAVYRAYKAAKELAKKGAADPVPLHLRNAPTGLMKNVGYGRGYVYPPENGYRRGCSDGLSLFPDNLKGTRLFDEQDVEPGHRLHPT